MHHLAPETPSPLASALAGRRSLLTLTGAAVAASALGPSLAQAGKVAKKARKRKKKKCRRQIDQCRNFFTELCAAPDSDCDDDDLEGFLASCDLLKNCKAAEAVDRFFEGIFGPRPVSISLADRIPGPS